MEEFNYIFDVKLLELLSKSIDVRHKKKAVIFYQKLYVSRRKINSNNLKKTN